MNLFFLVVIRIFYKFGIVDCNIIFIGNVFLGGILFKFSSFFFLKGLFLMIFFWVYNFVFFIYVLLIVWEVMLFYVGLFFLFNSYKNIYGFFIDFCGVFYVIYFVKENFLIGNY